jgi:hypothetical protein
MSEINDIPYDYSDNYFKGKPENPVHAESPLLTEESQEPLKLFQDTIGDIIPHQLTKQKRADLIRQAKDYNDKRKLLGINLDELLTMEQNQLPDQIYMCREGAASSIDVATEAVKRGANAKTLNGGFFGLTWHGNLQTIHNLRILSRVPEIKFTEYLYDEDMKKMLDLLEYRSNITVSNKRTNFLKHNKTENYIYASSLIPNKIKDNYINEEFITVNNSIETLIYDIADLLPVDNVSLFDSEGIFSMCPKESVNKYGDKIIPVISEKGIFIIEQLDALENLDLKYIIDSFLKDLKSRDIKNIKWVEDQNLIPIYKSDKPSFSVKMIPADSYRKNFQDCEKYDEYFIKDFIQTKVIDSFFPPNLRKKL